MENLFITISFLSFVAIGVFAILAVVNYLKKNKSKGKKMLKFTGVSTVIMVISFIGFAVTTDSNETAGEPDKVAATKTVKEEPIDEEAKAAAAEKKAAEEAAAAEKKAKKAEAKLAADKEYYLNEVKTKIDTQMKMYDAVWNEIWKPTFNGISDGTVDVYTAYKNMKTVEQRYDTLYSSFDAIPDEGLSKENKELLKDFKSKMQNAALMRGEAAEKARKMFDEGDYSPSRFDKVKSDVSIADSEMMYAVIALTSLEMNLGIEKE